MELDRAIKILKKRTQSLFVRANQVSLEATHLGIEALQRIQDMRTSPCTTSDEVLPGETVGEVATALPLYGSWTLCSCGHVAQEHNKARQCGRVGCTCSGYDGECKEEEKPSSWE